MFLSFPSDTVKLHSNLSIIHRFVFRTGLKEIAKLSKRTQWDSKFRTCDHSIVNCVLMLSACIPSIRLSAYLEIFVIRDLHAMSF